MTITHDDDVEITGNLDVAGNIDGEGAGWFRSGGFQQFGGTSPTSDWNNGVYFDPYDYDQPAMHVFRNYPAAICGPWIEFKARRHKSSPMGPVACQDGDTIASLQFYGANDAATAEDIRFVEIKVEVMDASEGTEDGKLIFCVQDAGSLVQKMRVQGDRVWINMPTDDLSIKDADDAGTVSSQAGYIEVVAGSSTRYIPLYSSKS